MGESILLVLWFGTTLYLGLKLDKERKDRENHEWWLSDVKDCIHSVEHEFQYNCEKIAMEEFSRQSFNKHKYDTRIRELEKSYKEDVTNKVIALKRVRVTMIPEHIVREYNGNIEKTADTYRFFGDLLSEHFIRKE